MQKNVTVRCPKCNHHHLYRYGKAPDGYQKYLCRSCHHQFAPGRPWARSWQIDERKRVCGKASFLHHDYDHYGNYRCCDKRCNHSFFVWKNTAITSPSMSSLFGKHNFKRMRYPVHLVITALSMFFLGKTHSVTSA